MDQSSDHPHDVHHAGLWEHVQLIRQRTLARRRLIGRMVAGAAVLLVEGCGGSGSDGSSSGSTTTTGSSSSSGSSSTTTTSSSSTCVADPAETNGPYPADGTNAVNGSTVNVLTQSGIVRSDITSSFGSSTTTAPGVPVTLTLTVVNASTSCSDLSGYAVYIWHCNRDGNYSLYSSGIQNENYLRGVQVTDSNGQVTFETIFPACYSGRYPHIHVEVYKSLSTATSQSNAVLTTQLAMPSATCNTVYGTATGYSRSVTNFSQVSTSTDNVFDSSSSEQLTVQTPTFSGSVDAGYVAAATIGVTV